MPKNSTMMIRSSLKVRRAWRWGIFLLLSMSLWMAESSYSLISSYW